ncbi:zinc-finger of the MIZ type in Nse subunit-domain-containing protein [Aspergillus karnatakaensis]|uniref:SUMO ligase MMS21 n=1 Tax=Aspergillus karnatakaensis TaxID=1810916 RepID=UPI003CCD463F
MLATPGPSRHRDRDRRDRNHSRPSGTPRTQDRNRDRDRDDGAEPTLPPYEPPIAPLNETGRTAFVALLRSQALRQLTTHIQHVEAKLTDSAGEVNERLTDAKERARKRKERAASRSMTEAGDGGDNGRESRGLDDDGEGETAELRELERNVKRVTAELDVSMRRAIDSRVRVERLEEGLSALQREVDAATAAQRPKQRAQRRTRRSGANEEDEEEGEDSEYEATPEPEAGGEEVSLRRKLEEKMEAEAADWEGMSLTERYSTNNDYIGFYRIIHEAQHPGDDPPPLPHASTWFVHLEDPATTTSRSQTTSSTRCTRQQPPSGSAAGPDDDDEIAIERERISLKCPLTLLPYRDPVTSTKCPHSFERDAITDMINQSSLTVPVPGQSGSGAGATRRNRVRAVKCPVCSEVLTTNDLREDPALLRRVKRAEAALRRVREEEEEEELGLSSARRSRNGKVMLGSDNDLPEENIGERMDVDTDQVRIKQERARSRGVTVEARSATEEDTEEDSNGEEEDEEEGEEEEEEEEE